MSENHDGAGDARLKRTPLHALHVEHKGRMVPFAGYEMPVQYPLGILKEHLHTRAAAGLFDVSHMGQIELRGADSTTEAAALALETLIPADLAGLAPGRQRYGFFTNEVGGIRDDLMIANLGDRLLLVVNAACKAADEAYLRDRLAGRVKIEVLDRSLIALQGPKAEAALGALAPECAGMKFLEAREISVGGAGCVVVRSGYTGEDGFEISVANDDVTALVQRLLENDDVALVGLGARDSLRLEAGLCLYGSDIDEQTSPVEADLRWAIPAVRRAGGARAGGFPGEDRIFSQFATGADSIRVGLKPAGRAPVRGGAELYETEDAGGDPIGQVTSGGFGPSLSAPVAMGYVPARLVDAGSRVFAEVRGQRLAVEVTKLPFIKPNYRR